MFERFSPDRCYNCVNYKRAWSVGSPFENYCLVTKQYIPLQHMSYLFDKSTDEFFKVCNYIKVVNL